MNMYDRPAQQQFIDTFVPIPFEQLFKLGQAFNEDVLRAELDLNATVSNWALFQSPSAADTEAWYNETLGRVKPLVDELATNIDILKTPEGRSMIAQLRNTTDYNKLSQLRLSREGMLQRQKANQELMSRGLYNPEWHDVDFTNYNSLENGVFNDVSPLAYKSIKDISDQYFNNLKDSYLYTKGFYDYKGVTPEMIQGIANEKINDIAATPYGQKHLEVLLRQGYSPEEAMQQFTNMVIGDNLEYARIDRSANPFAIMAYKNRPSSGTEEQAKPWISPKKAYLHTANDEANKKKMKIASLAALTPELINYERDRARINSALENRILEALDNKDFERAQELSEKYVDYNEKTDNIMRLKQQDAYLPLFNRYYRGKETKQRLADDNINAERFVKASKKMLDATSADMPVPDSQAILASQLGRPVVKTADGKYVSEETIFDINSQNLYFPQEIASELIGNGELGHGITSFWDFPERDVYQLWRNGDFGNLKIVNTPGNVNTFVGPDNQQNYMLKVQVEVPWNVFEEAGFGKVRGLNAIWNSRSDKIKGNLGARERELNGEKYFYIDMYTPISTDVLSNMGYDFSTIDRYELPGSTADQQRYQVVEDAITTSQTRQ